VRSPVGFGAVAQGEGAAGVGGVECLAEFVERTCHGPLGLPLARSGLHARMPNSLTQGRDLAQGTGQPAEWPEAPAEQELAFARNPALHDSTHRTVQPCPDGRRRRTRHRSAVAVLSALSARIDLVIASRSGFGSVELSAYRR
jgi:hypothetical protein